MDLLMTPGDVDSFLISSIVSGLFNSVSSDKIVTDRIVRVFDSPGDTQAMPIHISTAFDWVWHVGLLQKLKSYGISSSIFGFTHLFSVTDSLRWFWMGSVCKIISLMLEFLKVPFLFQQFSDYTSITFMMMLSVILLSMLMILHSTLKGIRH